MTYWLGARGGNKAVAGRDPIQMHSEMLHMTLREGLTDVKVSLSLAGSFGRGCANN